MILMEQIDAFSVLLDHVPIRNLMILNQTCKELYICESCRNTISSRLECMALVSHWKTKKDESKMLSNIREKLFNANVISSTYYNLMQTTDIASFDKSIQWRENRFAAEMWTDCFSFNNIQWTHYEMCFLKHVYNIHIRYCATI